MYVCIVYFLHNNKNSKRKGTITVCNIELLNSVDLNIVVPTFSCILEKIGNPENKKKLLESSGSGDQNGLYICR